MNQYAEINATCVFVFSRLVGIFCYLGATDLLMQVILPIIR